MNSGNVSYSLYSATKGTKRISFRQGIPVLELYKHKKERVSIKNTFAKKSSNDIWFKARWKRSFNSISTWSNFGKFWRHSIFLGIKGWFAKLKTHIPRKFLVWPEVLFLIFLWAIELNNVFLWILGGFRGSFHQGHFVELVLSIK